MITNQFWSVGLRKAGGLCGVCGLLVLLSVGACDRSSFHSLSNLPQSLINKHWRLTAVSAWPIPLDTVEFTMRLSEEYQLRGVTNCNEFFSAAIDRGPSRIRFAPVVRTLVGCGTYLGQVESQFYAAIGLTRAFEISAKELRFYAEDGAELLRFEYLQDVNPPATNSAVKP